MRSGLRADWSHNREFLRCVLGFACNQGFVFSLFYLGENRAIGAGMYAFERADLFGMLLCMLLAFALLRAASLRARDALLVRPLMWCYAGLLVLGSLIPLLVGDSGGIVVESALVGFPAALMLAAWGRALGGQPVARSIPEVFVALAVVAVVCLLIAVIPSPYALLVFKFMPLGSAWALQGVLPTPAGRRGRGSQMEGEVLKESGGSATFSFGDLLATKEQRDETARLSKKIFAGTLLFGLSAGCMETFGSDPGMDSTPAFFAALLLLAVFCVSALQLLGTDVLGDTAAEGSASSGEGPLDSVYRLAVLVMMAGFLFVPVLGSFGVPGEAIVLAGYLGLTYVLVSLFILMAKITSRDAAVTFAAGFIALYTGETAGVALGNAIELLEPVGQVPYAVAACAGLATLFAYLFLFTERDFRALSIIVRDADRFDDACRLIASTYGLSKREAELLPLALKGRTGERIAAEFFISKSTVETHLRRMYAKTGTHGRQELIDLGERTVRELSAKG